MAIELIIIFKIIVVLEWAFFILSVFALLIILCLLNYNIKFKNYFRKTSNSEKISLASIKLRAIRVNVILTTGITIIVLLILWYLVSAKSSVTNNPLAAEFIPLIIWGVIPIPCAILIFEFYSKELVKRLIDRS